tara:strand:+ start:143 stop:439 length:297 start_codon:yes stop_codon:yes gene_type:complete
MTIGTRFNGIQLNHQQVNAIITIQRITRKWIEGKSIWNRILDSVPVEMGQSAESYMVAVRSKLAGLAHLELKEERSLTVEIIDPSIVLTEEVQYAKIL